MKKKLAPLILAPLFALAAVAPAAADDEKSCWQKAPEDSPNPLLQILTVPFKMAYVITLLPRCAIVSIPKNEK